MDSVGAVAGTWRDFVVVALPGVQRFIVEARTTGDVVAASGIHSALAEQVVNAFDDVPGAEIVLLSAVREGEQAPDEAAVSGMPNRVVALLPSGSGAATAREAVTAVEEVWQGWVRQPPGPLISRYAHKWTPSRDQGVDQTCT